MTSQPRLIYFGSSPSSADILSRILDSKQAAQIVAVVTRAQKEHSHRHSQETAVAAVALAAGLPLLRPIRAIDCIEEIKQLEPTAGLLFAYGQILPPELLSAFPNGIINIHPSLLPKHRGPSPIEAAILAGDTEAGTSIMLIDEAMDSGPILHQTVFSIPADISKAALTTRLIEASWQALLPTLDSYISGNLVPQPQTNDGASYCKLIKKSDGELELSQETANSLQRKIRAYAGWPTVKIVLPDSTTTMTVHATHIDIAEPQNIPIGIWQREKQLILVTSDGSLIADTIQLPGKAKIAAAAALNGLRLPKLPAAPGSEAS